ncbi:MAG: TetR family transcriptional regulator [Kineosporiaceae bacterium]
MRSIAGASSRAARPEDLTARSRIRDAAVHRFAVDGFAGASLRAIAEDAGISPALVIHHFGSKEGLRAACDEHLLASLAATKHDAIDQPMTAAGLLGLLEGSGDLVGYLGRGLTDGSEHAAALFDSMVELSTTLLDRAVGTGMVRPTVDARARAAVLTTWQMGLLALSEHLSRALGEPVTSPRGLLRIERAAVEVYTHGLFTDDRFVDLVDEAAEQLLRGRSPTPGPAPTASATADDPSTGGEA